MMLVILDRDGVINEDSPDFVKTPDEWHPIPGSLTAIAALNRMGHQVVVATNQSGITRKCFSLSDLLAIHKKMQIELAKVGGHLDGIYFCPHWTEDHCPCRKPQPGMLKQIAKDFHTNLTQNAVLIGDSLRDLLAAHAVGCPAFLVTTGNGALTLPLIKDLSGVEGVYANLAEWQACYCPG